MKRKEAQTSQQSAWQHTFEFGGGKPIVVQPSQAQLSNDAGLPAVWMFDERIGLTAHVAAALSDARYGSQVWHSYLEHGAAAGVRESGGRRRSE